MQCKAACKITNLSFNVTYKSSKYLSSLGSTNSKAEERRCCSIAWHRELSKSSRMTFNGLTYFALHWIQLHCSNNTVGLQITSKHQKCAKIFKNRLISRLLPLIIKNNFLHGTKSTSTVTPNTLVVTQVTKLVANTCTSDTLTFKWPMKPCQSWSTIQTNNIWSVPWLHFIK